MDGLTPVEQLSGTLAKACGLTIIWIPLLRCLPSSQMCCSGSCDQHRKKCVKACKPDFDVCHSDHEERLAVKKKQEELGANEFAYVDVETRMIKVAERRSASQGSQGASLGAPVMSTMEADEYRREEEQERFELRMDKFWEEAEETQRRKLREEGQYEAREKRRAEERAPVARSQGLGAEPEANEDTQQPDVMASVLEEEHMLALEDDGLE